MAQKEVKIAFKVEGIDGYITDLNELQAALAKTDTQTDNLSTATDKLSDSQEKAQGDVKETTKTINSLNEELNKLQKELNETEVGSDAFTELEGKVKDAEDALASAKAGTQSFGGALGDVPGPVGNITKGVKGLGTALKALLANPIVLVIAAVVAALTALFKAFTSTKEGAEQFDRVLAGISAAVDVVRDRVLKFAGAIAKFFSGDFAGAFEDAKASVSGIGAEIAAEAAEAARLTGVLQKNADDIRALNVERAEQNALLAQNKNIIDDTSRSIEERKAALEEAATAETALLEKELRLQQERLGALEALAEQSDSDAETLDEIAQQRIVIAQLEEQSLNKQTELLGKRKALLAEEAAAEKALEDARRERRRKRQEAAQKQLENETAIAEELRRRRLDEEALELDDLRLKYEEQVKLAGKNEELIAQLKEQYDADVLASKKKFDDQRVEQEKTTQQQISDVLEQYANKEYASEQERILAELELQYQADLLKLQQAGATAEQLAALDKGYQDKVTAQTKKGEQDRAQLRQASIQQAGKLVGDLFAGFAALNDARTADDEEQAKKQFNLNKAFSITQALINTGLAISSVLAEEKGGALKKTIAAVAIGAQGLAQVLAIKNQKFNPNGGGGSEPPEPTFNPQAAIDARNQQLTGLQDAGAELSLAGQPEAPPIRAYVISTEVQSSLEANNQIENLSKL